jgi:methylenetetrahydrofolate reductase (NADPH)
VFWGASPVLSLNSKNYWEARNRAFFPRDFQPTLEWNREFTKTFIEKIKLRDGNAYFMPIKASILDCFKGIL